MPRAAKIGLAAFGAIALVIAGAIVWGVATGEDLTLRESMQRGLDRDRLRRGPFDKSTDVDGIIRAFDHGYGDTYRHDYLRVKGRFDGVTVDRDDGGLMIVAASTEGDIDRANALVCEYIGDFHLAHEFSKGQPIVMHAHGVVASKGVVWLVNCVLEPP